MIQVFQKIISEESDRDFLEIDTRESTHVNLTIWHWPDFEEINLSPDQVECLVQQLGAWLGEKVL